ncbi:hypothetical protein PDE_01578 [Penicillium oxalicum 114-2]|uniref:Uncharacterized protein n=1 Tax=Penicillium oxalicum (strain 114-2 / CGMCC 5302) TaxID=933388 RepID=S7Z7S2_PENO1|nr:hypothetical protein PDE_01578 [Penicillium oxalicum 114-2]
MGDFSSPILSLPGPQDLPDSHQACGSGHSNLSLFLFPPRASLFVCFPFLLKSLRLLCLSTGAVLELFLDPWTRCLQPFPFLFATVCVLFLVISTKAVFALQFSLSDYQFEFILFQKKNLP